MGEQREDETKKIVDVCSQVLIQNTQIDRQVKYKQKSDKGFKHRVETSLSTGLPLTVYYRARDRSLLSTLSSLCLGTGYKNILNVQKRVEDGILRRMQNTISVWVLARLSQEGCQSVLCTRQYWYAGGHTLQSKHIPWCKNIMECVLTGRWSNYSSSTVTFHYSKQTSKQTTKTRHRVVPRGTHNSAQTHHIFKVHTRLKVSSTKPIQAVHSYLDASKLPRGC